MRLGLLLCALLAAGTAAAAPGQLVRVQSVIDGDTVVLTDGRHVRLVQIDSPEVYPVAECYGAAARSALRRLLPPGTTVRFDADPALDRVDRYGRPLGYLFKGALNVNLELVRQGAATVYFYAHDRGRYADALLRAGTSARASRRGLWGACPRTPFNPYRGADTGP